LAVRHIELSQKSEGKILTIDLAAQRHRQRYGIVLELGRKIVAGLVHVNPDSHDSQVRRFVLCAHLHQHSGHFASIKLNVVRQFDRRFEVQACADHVRDRFDCPNPEPSRVA
jgi:hypothetical protein